MSVFLRMAWRNIWRHRRRTMIVVLAVGLTTALMMLYQGIMTGFDQAVYGNAIKVMGGNLQVHAPGYRESTDERPLLPIDDVQNAVDLALTSPHAAAATQRVNTGGMVTSRKGAFAVGIVGIEPEKELGVSLIGQRVTQGRFLTADDGDALVIGQGMADALAVAVGDRLTLVGRGAHGQMRQRAMMVVGIYDLGMPDIEMGALYLSLAKAQELYLEPGQSTEVVVWLKDLGQEPAVLRSLGPRMTAWELSSWRENFPELTQTMATKGAAMNVFGFIMLGVAGIGTLNLMLMSVYERTREIGVLGALGLKPRQISLVFLTEGTLLGFIGAVAGATLGVLLNALLSQVGIDFGAAMSQAADWTALIDGKVYSTLALGKLPMYIITALAISILASYYPAREAARREPAAALHAV